MKRVFLHLGKLNMGLPKMSKSNKLNINELKNKSFGNISFHVHEGIEYSQISINSYLFPIKFILTAIYSSIEQAYFIIDWSDGYFQVKIFGDMLDSHNLLDFSKEFQDRVTNHTLYALQSALTLPLKNLLLDASNFPYDYLKETFNQSKSIKSQDDSSKRFDVNEDSDEKIKKSIKSELEDIDLSDMDI